MAETKQISATIDNNLAEWVTKLAQEANRSFSQMIEILLKEAKEGRNGQLNQS